MQDVEPVGTLFSISKLSLGKSLSIKVEKTNVSRVSYSFEVESLVYVMTCVKPDITEAV